jgi:cystine transport system substrate-binding protein
MKMKSVLLIALVSAAVFLTGCRKKASDNLLSDIRKRGTIRVAMEGTYAPWSFHDENDNLVGFDVELAKNIAEKLGVKAEFVESPWDGIFAGLDAKRYDIVANEVEITDERAAKYDFSDPYAFIHTVIIVPKENESIRSFEDLNGKKTANTITSTYAALAEKYGAHTIGIDNFEQTLELLSAGRIDATLNSDISFYDYMHVHPDADYKIAATTAEPVLAAIPMRKGPETAELREAVNRALAELNESGVLSDISVKYFGQDVTRR